MEKDICRLCTKSGETLIDVLKETKSDELVANIDLCFGVKILPTDLVTKKICTQCFFLLNTYSRLRMTAMNNDIRLKKEYEERKKRTDEVQQLENSTRTSPSVTQDNFMNVLKLTSVRHESVKTEVKVQFGREFRYHPSVRKIKMQNSGVKIPKICRRLNMAPKVILDASPISKWKLHNSSKLKVWTVNHRRDDNPGLSLTRMLHKKDSPNRVTRLSRSISDIETAQFSVDNVTAPESNSTLEKNNADSHLEISNDNIHLQTDKRKLPKTTECQTKKKRMEVEEKNSEDDNVLVKPDIGNQTSNSNEQHSVQVIPRPKDQGKLDVLVSLIEHDKFLETNLEDYSEKEDNLLVEARHEQETFICQTCNKIFDSLKILKKHQKEHQYSSLRCQKCSKSFTMVEELIEHNIAMHITGNIDKKRAELNTVLNKLKEDIIQPANQISYDRDLNVTSKDELLSKNTANGTDIDISTSVTQENQPMNVTVQEDPSSTDNSNDTVLLQQNKIENLDNNTSLKDIPEPVNEYLISSDDDTDEVRIVSCSANVPVIQKATKNKATSLNVQDGHILEEALKSIQGGEADEKTDSSFLNAALQSQIPQDVSAYNSSDDKKSEDSASAKSQPNSVTSTIPHSSTTTENAPTSDECKLTSVAISDEDIYLKYVFTKIYNKKVFNSMNANPKDGSKPPSAHKMWELRNMDQLLRKKFIPVEYVTTNQNTVCMKYIFKADNAPKLKKTKYQWSSQNAIDIPNSTSTNTTCISSAQSGQGNAAVKLVNEQYPVQHHNYPANNTTQIPAIDKSAPMPQNTHILVNRSVSGHYNGPVQKSNVSQRNTVMDNRIPLPVQNYTVPLVSEQLITKLLPNGIIELVSADVNSALMSVLPKGVQKAFAENVPCNNQAVVSNINGNSMHSQKTFHQTYEQHVYSKKQNVGNVNIPVKQTNTSMAMAESTSNYTTLPGPSTSELVSHTFTSKPKLRLKKLSELTENTNERNTLQSMYMQTFIDYLTTVSNGKLNTTNTGDEYLQIS